MNGSMDGSGSYPIVNSGNSQQQHPAPPQSQQHQSNVASSNMDGASYNDSQVFGGYNNNNGYAQQNANAALHAAVQQGQWSVLGGSYQIMNNVAQPSSNYPIANSNNPQYPNTNISYSQQSSSSSGMQTTSLNAWGAWSNSQQLPSNTSSQQGNASNANGQNQLIRFMTGAGSTQGVNSSYNHSYNQSDNVGVASGGGSGSFSSGQVGAAGVTMDVPNSVASVNASTIQQPSAFTIGGISAAKSSVGGNVGTSSDQVGGTNSAPSTNNSQQFASLSPSVGINGQSNCNKVHQSSATQSETMNINSLQSGMTHGNPSSFTANGAATSPSGNLTSSAFTTSANNLGSALTNNNTTGQLIQNVVSYFSPAKKDQPVGQDEAKIEETQHIKERTSKHALSDDSKNADTKDETDTPPEYKPLENTMENLLALVTKSKAKKRPVKSSTQPPIVSSKYIEIPAEFLPSHSYRATAAYSLLRTLSKELRLSPFTLQAFLQGLMLPVPSRLMGEVHVRVMRLLCANIGMGSYSRFGEGTLSARTKRGDNLYFLDSGTWPLFYEEYVLATESKFVDLDDGKASIDTRTAIMFPTDSVEMNPRQTNKRPRACKRVPYPGEGWIDRCPVGPLGQRNNMGRFTCCPFHIATAVKAARKGQHGPAARNIATIAPAVKESQTPKKRGRPARSAARKRSKKADSDESSSDDDYESDDSHDFVSSFEKREPPKKRRRPRKNPVVGVTVIHTPNVVYPAQPTSINRPCPYEPSKKLNRVMPVDGLLHAPGNAAKPIAYPPPATVGVNRHPWKNPVVGVTIIHTPNDVYPPSPAPKLMGAPLVHALASKEPAHPLTLNTVPSIHKPSLPVTTDVSSVPVKVDPPPYYVPKSNTAPPNAQSNAASHNTSATSSVLPKVLHVLPPQPTYARQCQPILVPPIPPQDEDLDALVVSKGAEKTIARYFLEGDLFVGDTKACDVDGSKGDAAFDGEVGVSVSENFSAHKIPIKQLRKGIPYHHLSLEAKLTMLEFLLDELLTVPEIAGEMTRRHQITDSIELPYGGPPPLSHEFAEIVNDDECTVCGIEGDLFCCDGCPGSFHRQCIGVARLPEGKWLCPECKTVDATKLAPLGSDRRPFIGWFTFDELKEGIERPMITEQQSDPIYETQTVLPTAPQSPPGFPATFPPHLHPNELMTHPAQQIGNPQSCPAQMNPNQQTTISNQANTNSQAVANSDVGEIQCKIPKDVELLVSAGKVFARYRSSLLPFDPLEPGPSLESTAVSLATMKPPVPLNCAQLTELLKLLGPKMCLLPPWIRLSFSPRKLFVDASPNAIQPGMVESINKLIAFKNEERLMAVASNSAEINNAMLYENKFRRAPADVLVQHQLGQFILPAQMSDIISHTTKVGGLTNASLDPTAEQVPSVRIHYFDPLLSLCDKMVTFERLFRDAYLLDDRWGTNGDEMDDYGWSHRVRSASSITELAALLVKLVDACSLRAFQLKWFAVKDNGNDEEVARLSEGQSEPSALADDWTLEKEQHRRKWERCTGAFILRLLKDDGIADKIFEEGDSTTKRGKKQKLVNDNPNAATAGTSSSELTNIFNDVANDQIASQATINDVKKEISSPSADPVTSTNEKLPKADGIGVVESEMHNNSAELVKSDSVAGATSEVHSFPAMLTAKNDAASDDVCMNEVDEPLRMRGGGPEDEPIKGSSDASSAMNQSDTASATPVSRGLPSSSVGIQSPTKRCGKCETCLQVDCRTCIFCLDMPRYGGPNIRKKRCMMKKNCLYQDEETSRSDNPDGVIVDLPPKKRGRGRPRKDGKESVPRQKLATAQKPPKPKSTKKRRQTIDAVPHMPSNSRRRSGRLNIARHQIETLLGINEGQVTSKIEKAINDAKIDKLEELLAESDKASYFAIAGRKVSLFSESFFCHCHVISFLRMNYSRSCLSQKEQCHLILPRDLGETQAQSVHPQLHTKLSLKLVRVPRAIIGER